MAQCLTGTHTLFGVHAGPAKTLTKHGANIMARNLIAFAAALGVSGLFFAVTLA